MDGQEVGAGSVPGSRVGSLIRLNVLTDLRCRGLLTDELMWRGRNQPRDVSYQAV
jgi:hypothetical protein